MLYIIVKYILCHQDPYYQVSILFVYKQNEIKQQMDNNYSYYSYLGYQDPRYKIAFKLRKLTLKLDQATEGPTIQLTKLCIEMLNHAIYTDAWTYLKRK